MAPNAIPTAAKREREKSLAERRKMKVDRRRYAKERKATSGTRMDGVDTDIADIKLGPQTLAELHSRSERLATPADIDEVRHALERLGQRTPALVVNLGRAPGQREDRYMHLLCGPVSAEDFTAAGDDERAPPRRGGLDARLEALEAEVAALRGELEALRNREQ